MRGLFQIPNLDRNKGVMNGGVPGLNDGSVIDLFLRGGGKMVSGP